MLVRDFIQPSGWETGCPDAPRARKIVFPVGLVIESLEWTEHTGLHAHETSPGIVGTAIAESRN